MTVQWCKGSEPRALFVFVGPHSVIRLRNALRPSSFPPPYPPPPGDFPPPAPLTAHPSVRVPLPSLGPLPPARTAVIHRGQQRLRWNLPGGNSSARPYSRICFCSFSSSRVSSLSRSLSLSLFLFLCFRFPLYYYLSRYTDLHSSVHSSVHICPTSA